MTTACIFGLELDKELPGDIRELHMWFALEQVTDKRTMHGLKHRPLPRFDTAGLGFHRADDERDLVVVIVGVVVSTPFCILVVMVT